MTKRGHTVPAMASDDLFRRARARVVASLTAALGPAHLDLVEDAVQDALVSALRTWAYVNAPADPASWLYRAARNRAIDLLRRERRYEALDERLVAAQSEGSAEASIRDNELRVLLMCCHPILSTTARVALALNVAAGLTPPQIARALLMTEPAARQVLVRAKRRLRNESVELTLPDKSDLDGRLDATLATIYLMFNEGYSAGDGEQLIRSELCYEAIRLCGLLLDSPLTAQPQAYALCALLLLLSARLEARLDENGEVVLLVDQDRGAWNKRHIALAFDLLDKGAAGSVVSTYHLEAEIASYHARAESMAATDWNSIVQAYNALVALNPSPVVCLNRAVALAARDGVTAALAEVEALEVFPALAAYPFFHTTRGHLLSRAGRHVESQAAFAKALSLATSQPVHRFCASRLGQEQVSKTDHVERL